MNNKDVQRGINFCNATLKKMKLDIIIFYESNMLHVKQV